MAQRKRYVFVCTNRRPDGNPKGSCAQKGSEAILTALKSEFARRGLAATEVRACAVSCLDLCSSGATVLVEPDHIFYGRVAPDDVPVLAEAIAAGQPVPRLVLSEDDLHKS